MGFVGDLFGLKYSRWVHLVLLLLLVALYITLIVLYIVSDGSLSFSNGCSAVLSLLFVGFWFMRGLRKLDGCFPWFHYITLVFELIAHMISYESNTLTEESK